jgi:Phage integrase family
VSVSLEAHPHMLRHACGYALANKGHDTRAIQGWLGHRSITSTAVYTALAPNSSRISGGIDCLQRNYLAIRELGCRRMATRAGRHPPL